LYQQEALRDYNADEFGYEHVSGFGKFTFIENFDWENVKRRPLRNSLYIIPSDEAEHDDSNIYKIDYPNGHTALKFFEFKT